MTDKERDDELQSQTENTEPDEEGDEDEYGLDEDFRSLEADAIEQRKRFKQLALQADKAGDSGTARVIREVGTNVMQMLLDVIQSTGGAMAIIDERLDMVEEQTFEEVSRLTERDAKELHLLIQANLKLVGELLEKGGAHEGVDALRKANEDMLARVVSMSSWTPTTEAPSAQA